MMEVPQLLSLQKAILRHCDNHLQDMVLTSVKCVMIRGRLDLDINRGRMNVIRKMRHYLEIPIIPAHRRAITSIMFSSHGLAVERLRWKERYRGPVPREWHLCRFCLTQVEDEVHALMDCQGDRSHQLVLIREVMRREVHNILPDFEWHLDSESYTQLQYLLHDGRLSVPIAAFVYKVLTHFDSVPMYIPAPFLYTPLLPT